MRDGQHKHLACNLNESNYVEHLGLDGRVILQMNLKNVENEVVD